VIIRILIHLELMILHIVVGATLESIFCTSLVKDFDDNLLAFVDHDLV
jgi:hypothetical protein